jgi:hypothetical protein
MRTKLFGAAYLFLSWFDSRIAAAPETHMHMRKRHAPAMRLADFFEMKQGVQDRPGPFVGYLIKYLATASFAKSMTIVAACIWSVAKR